MKVYRYTLAEVPKVCIPLGVAGEHLATRIEIDCTPWLAELPAASVALLVEQPDGNKYPASVTMDGYIAIWTLQGTDTSLPGYGKVEVRCNCPEGNQQYISITGRTHLYPSINQPEGGDPVQPWVEDVLQAGASAKVSAEAAAKSAEASVSSATAAAASEAAAAESEKAAEQAKENATTSEKSAAQSADRAEMAATASGWFDVEVNEAGHLIYTRSETVDAIDFEMQEGRLLVNYG